MAEFDMSDFLAHYGIDGQKWGVRNGPPYPLKRSSNGSEKKSFKKAVKNAYEKHKQNRAESKEKSKETARKMLKQYTRNHPELLPYLANGMTKDEVNDVIKDIEWDRKLNKIREEALNSKWQKRQRTANNIGTISTLINNSKNLYNNSIEIANHFRDSDHQIRKVGEKKEKDRKRIQSIVMTGSAKDVLSNISGMTSKELEDAMKRLNYQDKLNERISKG